MGSTLLGAPLVVWGSLCLILTVVWLIIWPRNKAIGVAGARFVVLRWFHALVWLLLAIAAFLAAGNTFGGASTAHVVAFLSLITYLVFMWMLVTSR